MDVLIPYSHFMFAIIKSMQYAVAFSQNNIFWHAQVYVSKWKQMYIHGYLAQKMRLLNISSLASEQKRKQKSCRFTFSNFSSVFKFRRPCITLKGVWENFHCWNVMMRCTCPSHQGSRWLNYWGDCLSLTEEEKCMMFKSFVLYRIQFHPNSITYIIAWLAWLADALFLPIHLPTTATSSWGKFSASFSDSQWEQDTQHSGSRGGW